MGGNLVDTNIIIKLLNGEQNTIDIFDSLDEVKISSITAGELYYGAKKSRRIDENMEIFREFLSMFPILAIDEKVSNIYGELKARLVKIGVNIPENDIWIAATALYNNLALVTYDEHFKSIEGLDLKLL
ncbi:MAG: type II toxin-antitoxin system VapC family toxin [Clostridia bacterium]|nr:type II toxin-antitoxin system VapC family toxin [Clostridia bacterium]